jgi:hypothetical protein
MRIWAIAIFVAPLILPGFQGTVTAGEITATWMGGSGLWIFGGRWNFSPDPCSQTTYPNNDFGCFFTVLIDNDPGATSPVSLPVNVTIDGLTVDEFDSLEITDGQSLTIEKHSLRPSGTITNSGTITLNSDGTSPDTTDLALSGGDVILNGGGTVTLSDSPFNRILGDSGTERLINVDNTIQGAGQIGVDSMALTNQGLIDANQVNISPIPLEIDPNSSGLINSGTMQASNGGILRLLQLGIHFYAAG